MIWRERMDNFMDTLAQKFTAGEVIRANTVAEERELNRLREQVTEYERCLQELRQVQMYNTQAALSLTETMEENRSSLQRMTEENIAMLRQTVEENCKHLNQFMEEKRNSLNQLVQDSLLKIEETQIQLQKEQAEEAIRDSVKTQARTEEQIKELQNTLIVLAQAVEKNQKEISEWFQQADEFVHRENVKVYRNVQAVVVEEEKTKTEMILKKQEEIGKKYGISILLGIINIFLLVANLIVLILR